MTEVFINWHSGQCTLTLPIVPREGEKILLADGLNLLVKWVQWRGLLEGQPTAHLFCDEEEH